MLFLCWSIYKMASVEQNIDDTSLIIPVMFFRWFLLWESAQDLAHEDYYSKKKYIQYMNLKIWDDLLFSLQNHKILQEVLKLNCLLLISILSILLLINQLNH